MIETVLIQRIADLGLFVYALIFIGMLLEGEIVLFTSAYFAHQGILDPRIAFPIIIIGVLLGDTFWYFMGARYANSIGWIKKIIDRAEIRFGAKLKNRILPTYIVSKFTYGLHRTVLLTSGAFKIPFKKFFPSDLAASLLWILAISALAYFSSASVAQLKHRLRFFEFGLLAGILILIGVHFLLARWAKRH